MYLITAGIGPIGALVGGLLAEFIGVRNALFVAVVCSSFGGLWIVFSPIRKLRHLLT